MKHLSQCSMGSSVLTEPCPHLQLLFPVFLQDSCSVYHIPCVLTNLQQLNSCLLCSARCGGYKFACLQVSGTVGVSAFFLDSHLILPAGLGFFLLTYIHSSFPFCLCCVQYPSCLRIILPSLHAFCAAITFPGKITPLV